MFTTSPVELLQNLIRFNTSNPPGNEAECIAYINKLLTQAGFETALVGRVPERPNLVTRLRGRGNAKPLLIYGHVDVQSTEGQKWQYPPFEGKIVDGYIWGRGALDMKGEVAMMLTAMLRAKHDGLAPAGDVMFAVLSDEELLRGPVLSGKSCVYVRRCSLWYQRVWGIYFPYRQTQVLPHSNSGETDLYSKSHR